MHREILGRRIKELRDQKGMSQQDIAYVLGTTRQRVSRIEKGTANASFETLQRISNALGVELSSITSAIDDEMSLTVRFRNASDVEAEDAVNQIENILKVFGAHMSLNRRMKEQG